MEKLSLDAGRLVLDTVQHEVLVEGEPVDLTPNEYKLLVTLARYPGRVYSRFELINHVQGYDYEGYERTIDVHVKNLRRKIETLEHEEQLRRASVADLAHELRTPVSGLLSRIEAAQAGVLADPEAL